MTRKFFRYVLPSMLTMLLTGFYAMVDGFFVGRAVGDVGLAAINIAWPVTAVILAVGTGIGAGGSVLLSRRRGEGDEAGAFRALAETVLLLAAASVLFTAAFLALRRPLLLAFGARGEVLAAAEEYVLFIVAGCALQIFGTGLSPLLRNRGKTVQAMLIMVAGLAANILLDYLLVMRCSMRLAGAAIATVAAQGVTALGTALALFWRRADRPKRAQFRLTGRDVARILTTAISPFGISLMPSVIVMFNNWQCLRYGGDTAAAAYAVLSYVLSSVQLLLSGGGEGIQPLISECRGAGDEAGIRGYLRRALLLVLILSAALALLTATLAGVFPVLFGTSAEAGEMIEEALLWYSPAYVAMGFARLYSSYYYARGESWRSNALIYSDPVLFSPLLLFTLPLGLGLTGVWVAFPASQLLLAGLAAALGAIRGGGKKHAQR